MSIAFKWVGPLQWSWRTSVCEHLYNNNSCRFSTAALTTILLMAGLTWQPVWASSLLGSPPPWTRHNMVCLLQRPPRAHLLSQDRRRNIVMQEWASCVWRVWILFTLPTINRWTWFEAKGGAKACAVIEAPALLDLPWAGGIGHVLLAGGASDAGAGGQWWRPAPNALGWSGIVHPDPIPKAHFAADSEDHIVKHLSAQFSFWINTGFSQRSQCLWP